MMKRLRYLPDVVTLRLDAALCNGCARCEEVCPHEVFVLENRKAVIADRDACMECGACALNCPSEALTVESGVGCAWAVIMGWIKRSEPTCGCGADDHGCC